MMFDQGKFDTTLENSFQGIQYNVCTCSHWLNNIKVAWACKITIYQSSIDFDEQFYVQVLGKMSSQCRGNGELKCVI